MRNQTSRRGNFCRRNGMTLIELLVVIFIIGILMALLIPAVQSAREAARRAQCTSQLHQLYLGIANHETVYGKIPSNGWGYRWVGDPDRDTGPRQPGGWAYNILSYLEQQNLRYLGRRMSEAEQRVALSQLIQTPLAVFKCPTRGPVALFDNDPSTAPINADWAKFVARTDYAVNEGDVHIRTNAGPTSLAEGDNPSYRWPDISKASGICYVRSQVVMPSIVDGTSNVYFLGEKYVNSFEYLTIEDPGYDQSLYSGADLDTNRTTELPPAPDRMDLSHQPNGGARVFGGPHSDAVNMVFGDGHVSRINYSIDPILHARLGNRHDGHPASDPSQ